VNSVERWIGDLGYGEVPGTLLERADDVPADHPFVSEVEAMFNGSTDVGASAILCIDRVPTVCLVDAAKLTGPQQAQTDQIRRFCERLWNQNLARISWSLETNRLKHGRSTIRKLHARQFFRRPASA
jgi:hypothetical protein